MKHTNEQLCRAAEELNALGFEPKIETNNENVHPLHLEIEITGKVYSLISYGFVRNKSIAIDLFIKMMQNKLSTETLSLLRHLLENCNIREVGKDLFEIRKTNNSNKSRDKA